MKRAIFLDRDNTIIENDVDMADPDQVKLIQGAASAIASMRGLGYQIVVISNQGGVARGAFTEQDVQATHQRIAHQLQQQANGALIERFYFCPYHPDGVVPGYRREHPWRKPQPGMLLQAADDLQLDLPQCWMIGDQLRDIEAGAAAGVRTILLADPDHVPAVTNEAPVKPDFIARNLIEAARLIAQHPRLTPPITRDDSAARSRSDQAGKTFPARQNLGAARHTGAAASRKPRPFKPWDIQPAEQPDTPAPAATESAPAPPPPAVSSPGPPPPDRPAPPADKPPAPPPRAQPPAEPPAAPTPEPVPVDSTDRLLQQILRQLKKNEVDYGEWSSYKLLGLGIGQPLVIAAVLAGLFMAKDSAVTMTWLLGAAVGQLFVIAMLILHGQR